MALVARQFAAAIAFITGLLGCDVSSGSRQSMETGPHSSPGQPSLTLKISGGATAVAGQEYGLEVTLTNGAEPKSVAVPALDEDWKFEVRDVTGRTLRGLAAVPTGLPKVCTVWLGRYSTWSVKLKLEFDKADVYQLRAIYPGPVVKEWLDRSNSVPEGTFRQEISSNWLKVEVRKGNQ